MITEEQLRQSARRAGQALVDNLPPPEACTHEFSPAFERKMNRLLRRTRNRGLYTGMKRAAAFFLAILLTATAWLSVDARAREYVFGWVSQKYGNSEHYYYAEEEDVPPDEIPEVRYSLAEIPAGYSLDHTINEGSYHSISYINDAGTRYLTFGYLTKETSTTTSNIVFATQDTQRKTVLVHGEPADFYLALTEEITNTVVWKDKQTDVLLYIDGDFSEQELIQMAENVISGKR